jgi:hypothetical protein
MSDYKREQWLSAHGWDVETKIQSNAGSETVRHFVCKALVVYYLRQQGLRVTTEAAHGDRGTVDVLCHGPEDGAPYAVEVETSPKEETIREKHDKYIQNSPLREMFVLNVSEMPENILDAYAWVETQLP